MLGDDPVLNLDVFTPKRPEYAPVAKSLEQIGMHSAVDLFSTFAGQAPDFSQALIPEPPTSTPSR